MTEAAPFDAWLDVPVAGKGTEAAAFVVIRGRRLAAAFADYGLPGRRGTPFVRVTPVASVEAKWGDPFEVLSAGGRRLGRGTVLLPRLPRAVELKMTKRRALLEGLSRGEREMLLAFAEMKGIQGLREEELTFLCRLDRPRLEALASTLEGEGRLRILSFSPLVVVSQESLDFLRRRLSAYLAQFHKKHPGRKGVGIDNIEKRFGLARNIILLALRSLVRDGLATFEDGVAALAGFHLSLSGEDERLLGELESMILKGEFAAMSLDDLRTSLRLTRGKLQALLSVLAEREKIVKGKDGFFLHSRWLDELIQRIRGSGRKELTVADFKAITGLTRKYAIPLLELLDEMGVTRRKGAVRDVLR